MSYLTWREGRIVQQPECRVIHVCQAPVEALYVDDHGLVVLTARGVERVRVMEEP